MLARRKKKNLLVRLSCLILVCYFSVNLIDNYNTLTSKKRELEIVKQSCEKQKIANRELKTILSTSNSKEYVEKTAREKLGFVYPDERIFIDVSGK